MDDTTGSIQYLHGDNLGSVRLITDSGGQLVGASSYDAYGVLTGHTGSVDSAIGFTGNWTDSVTGLVYLRARDYDPHTGQFLTVDPAEDRTRQPYAYVANDPLRQTDPTGLFGCSSLTTSWGLDLCGSASIVKNEAIGAVKAGIAMNLAMHDSAGTALSLLNACQAGLNSSGGVLQCIDNVNPFGAGGLRGQVAQTWRDIQAGCTSQAGQDIGALQLQAVLAAAGGAEDLAVPLTAQGGGSLSDIVANATPKASVLRSYAESEGWKASQTTTGPLKYTDQNGIVRMVLKRGSPRTPGSEGPHVALRGADDQRMDPQGNPVTRKSLRNHTPIEWDLP